MTDPHRYLLRMLVFLAVVAAVCALLFPGLSAAFRVNPPLNGLILGVFALGVLYALRQVTRLTPEVAWIEHYRADQPREKAPDKNPTAKTPPAPRLLAPMAAMLGERRGRLMLSAPAMRSLLDGIASRLDEARDLSRYLIVLLIFLGLLGTFWGLIEAIGAISGVIAGLSIGTGDFVTLFNDLKSGLQRPLGGMGTAFSASLFGLAGSLILGFLDLQASQAENSFMNELEEWLSGITRLAVPEAGFSEFGGPPQIGRAHV